jgi:hypothetical protein
MAHPIADAISLLATAEERHAYKAHAFAALTGQVGRSVSRTIKGVVWTLTLTSAPTFADGVLTFSVRIQRAEVDVTPKDLNPIRVVNPPILVDDPAGDIVRTWVNPVTGVVTTRTLRENLPAALLAIVRDLVRG